MAVTEEHKGEIRDKVNKLVRDRFGEDYHKAFDHYDSNDQDGKISRSELLKFLEDARVGNWLSRSAWASGILAELDTDKDGSISRAEFEDMLKK